MSRERNELSMESGMESIRKGSIYIAALLFQIYKKKKGTVVPVPLSPVSIPLVQNLAVGNRYRYRTYWYRYRRVDFWQIRVLNPFFAPLFTPLLIHHYIRQTLALLTSYTRKSKIARSCQCFHRSDPDSSQFEVQPG